MKPQPPVTRMEDMNFLSGKAGPSTTRLTIPPAAGTCQGGHEGKLRGSWRLLRKFWVAARNGFAAKRRALWPRSGLAAGKFFGELVTKSRFFLDITPCALYS